MSPPWAVEKNRPAAIVLLEAAKITMSVSVVMSVYDGQEFLTPSIESVLRQTYTDFEFVIVDDGSRDGSPAILDDYSRRDPRIRVMHQENRGLAASLNLAIERARHDLIVRMDSDDLMLPCRLQHQVEFMAEHPSVSVACSFTELIDRDGRKIATSRPVVDVDRGRRERDAKWFVEIVHPSVIMRRAHFLNVGGYRSDYKFAEDRELWGRFVTSGYRIEVIPETLLRYRLHGDSMSTRDMARNDLICRYIDHNIERRLSGKADIALEEFCEWRTQLPLSAKVSDSFRSSKLLYYKKATRHFAERRWLQFVGCFTLATALAPYSTAKRALSKLLVRPADQSHL
jgi:glycosyltransferase involved in cell wall biosynthesis